MPGIEDVQFQAPRTPTPPPSGGGGIRVPRAALIVIAVAILAIAGYLVYSGRSAPASAPAPVATATPQAEKPLGDAAERINLPALDDSDALVRQRVGVLSSHPLVAAWLATSGLVRNFVVVIDNISHGMTPSSHLRVLRPGGQFRVLTRGDRMFLDPRNYDRYTRIAGAATSIDPRAAARTYGTFKPLLQMAYDELGNQEPIDRALERAIVALLQVPAVDGAVRVEQGGEGIGYEYADPKLEALTGAQKQLLRMGPANVRMIQEQLRLFALALGIPAQRLSPGSPKPNVQHVGALDQGTTSTRFMIFDAAGVEVARHQIEHRQFLSGPGLVEHDPMEIIERVNGVIAAALHSARLTGKDLAAIGITNQRETTVVWNPKTGRPWHNAIVWQDTRTDRAARALEPQRALLGERTGLPPATYFSALKLQWILDHVDGVRGAAERGDAVFGTVDSWVIWNLTGGSDGGLHVTDVTNASRTQLLSLRTCDWDKELLDLFNIPRRMLPSIHSSSSSSAYGTTRSSALPGLEVPIGGDLGDQHAALVGQTCFAPGEAKNTYGTGNFMLLNTGGRIVPSNAGLLTTLGYRFEGMPAVYALEGSVAVTGAAVQWLRDQLQIIRTADEIEALAVSVPDSGGIYFVPAFSGLFAPYWRPDARGAIVGLSRFHTKAHLARAALEAICFQTRDVLDAMTRDSGVRLDVLKVDGGATVNNLLLQLQADILGVPVVRPVVVETTALGAAYAAGLAVGFWNDPESLRRNWKADRQWEPRWSADQRDAAYRGWRKAVDRSLNWAED